MAITKILPIKMTVDKAINYSKKDKEKLVVKKEVDTSDLVDYTTQDKEILLKNCELRLCKTISTTGNCSLIDTAKQWEKVREYHHKNTKNLAFHVIQNFGVEFDPQLANEIGVRLAKELFGDFQYIVSTHTNTDSTHNHIVFNAVSFKTGMKYYDTLDSYKKIRETSDKLCYEYGLPVLENTKDFKLIKYRDSEGKYKYFEPTTRKSELNNEKETSHKFNYKEDSHRFLLEQSFEKSAREQIKEDIDFFIEDAKSFDHLLHSLKAMGYQIKDKLKDDKTYRKHISFLLPGQKKYVRDKTLGESYTRTALENKIESLQAEKEKAKQSNLNSENQIHKDDQIHKDEGLLLINFNIFIQNDIFRSEKELSDIRIRENQAFVPSSKIDARKKYLIECIDNNLRTMNFVNENKITTFNDLNTGVSELYETKRIAEYELSKIKGALTEFDEIFKIIKTYQVTAAQYKQNVDADDGANGFEKETEFEQLKRYESILKKAGLASEKSQIEFIKKCSNYKNRYQTLHKALLNVQDQIKQYENCVKTIKRIDRSNLEQKYHDEIQMFENLHRYKDPSDKSPQIRSNNQEYFKASKDNQNRPTRR